MRAFIKNYIQSERDRREENGQSGFSLIELIVVVVVLGILAAIAIPIFLNIQAQASTNALETVAANGATQAAAAFAQGETPTFDNLETDGTTVTLVSGSEDDLDDVCVSATKDTETVQSGPGCDVAEEEE